MKKRARRRLPVRLALGLGVPLLAIFLLDGPRTSAHEPELSRHTYWRDIRPLIERHCQACHAGSGPAPVNLMRYGGTAPWANSIARNVLERRMPPWLPDDGIGEFAHARTLDERETDMLVDWAIGLAPEGTPPDEPELSSGEPGDPPGEPAEGALRATDPVRVGADQSEAVVCAPLARNDAPETARGFAFDPGDAAPILRRAVLFVGEGACDAGTPIFTWVVGQGARTRPDGAFDLLPANVPLFLRLEYRKGFDTEGVAYEHVPEVAVLGGDDEASRGKAVETLPVGTGETSLGGDDAEVALLAVYPPAGLEPGPDGFVVEAVGPGGASRELIRIRRFDPDWAEKFFFRAPVRIEPGGRVRTSHPGAFLDIVRTPAATADGAPNGGSEPD